MIRTLIGPGKAVHLGSWWRKSVANHQTESPIEQLTTMNSRYCRKVSFVIEPSTTVPSIIPSRFINASRDTRLPRLNGSFFCALIPFLARPFIFQCFVQDGKLN